MRNTTTNVKFNKIDIRQIIQAKNYGLGRRWTELISLHIWCLFSAKNIQKCKKTKNSTKKTQLKKINEYLCCIPWDVRISCITFSGVTETTYGEVPEWLNGSDCKSDGSAFDGSNPSLSTISAMRASYSGYYPSLPSLRDGFDSRCPLQCNLMISLDLKSIKILNFSRE